MPSRSVGSGVQGPVQGIYHDRAILPGGFEPAAPDSPPTALGAGPWLRGLTGLLRPEVEFDTAAKLPYPVVRPRRAWWMSPGGAPVPYVRV